MGSDGAFSRRARTTNGMASAVIAADTTYDAAYPEASATRPRTGCATTPPADPINESNDSTVARSDEGMRPLMKAWRNGSTDAVAFKNANGSIVTQVYNKGNAAKTTTVSAAGKLFQFSVPAHGWATLVTP